MENHPIPQDVTGFKFRLIGSITVKQFLYLLGAGIFALIFYLMPIPLVIKIPAMIFPGIIGMALAFIPIDGRPMDKMISNFARALPSENQYIYHKKGVEMPYFYFNPAPQHVKQNTAAQQTSSAAADKALLFNSLSRSYFKPDEDEQKGLESLNSLFTEGVKENNGVGSKVIHADAPAPTPEPSTAAPVLPSAPKPEPVKTEPVQAATPVPETPVGQAAQPAAPQQAPAPLAQPITIQPETPKASAPTAPLPGQNITPLTADAASQFDAPNVIKGVIKDPRGKPLPHVIVEIIDMNNIPQRTFRTNQNGVFAAATAMPNGEYTIHLEDTLKKQEFEDKKIKLDGGILPELIIASVDQREKLRRELFGVAPHA
ncbi:MAG: PrgI family mobile element protein [Candidatus Levyibacteriota bacterium]